MNLRHRVRLEGKTSERSSSGAVIDAWGTFADNLPADIRPLSGRELIAAQQVNSEISGWIGIRYMPGIEPTMRVVNPYDGNRVYQIHAVLPDPTQRSWIRLMVSTGTNQGQ